MKGFLMLRVEQENESIMPVLLGSGTQQFRIAEHVLATPLWHIRVLPKTEGDPDDLVWSTFLATDSGPAAPLISDAQWDEVRVHVLLPGHMTETGEPALTKCSASLTKCSALWECRSIQNEHRETWLLETDLGTFIDPGYGVDPEDTKKLTLWWQQHRTESAAVKTAKRTSKQ